MPYVQITAEQRVRYDQTVFIPAKEWKEMTAGSEDETAAQLRDWINTSDIDDAEEMEPEDIDFAVVPKPGSKVKAKKAK